LPASPTTLFQELVAAGQGIALLIRGDRTAARHFDASRRGVAGSFIALLLLVVALALLPIAVQGPQPGAIAESLISNVALCAAEVAFAAIALRQLGRLDGLPLYIVVSNWINVFGTVAAVLLLAIGFPASITVFAIVVALFVLEINLGRRLLNLQPLQVAMLLIAQMVGISIGLVLIGLLLPGSPDAASLTQPQ
jgi:hypothetical protein